MLPNKKTVRFYWTGGGEIRLFECDSNGNERVVPESRHAEFAQELLHADMTVPIPTPTENVETALQWVKFPEVMLKALTSELNDILDLCEARYDNGLVIQIKSQILASIKGREPRTQRQGPVQFVRATWSQALAQYPAELVITSGALTGLLQIVNLTNSIQSTPFVGKIVWNMQRRVFDGDSVEFDCAIRNWREALQLLAEWIGVRNALDDKSGLPISSFASSSDEKDDQQRILANDPRTEFMRQIIVEHPEWVNGNRDEILRTLKDRYENPETGRRGIGRAMGLMIIKGIVNGEI